MTIDKIIDRRRLEPADGSQLEIPCARFYRGHHMEYALGDFIFDLPGWRFQEIMSNGYREVYVNEIDRAIFTYCEGDLDLTIDETDADFQRRLESARKFYTEVATR